MFLKTGLRMAVGFFMVVAIVGALRLWSQDQAARAPGNPSRLLASATQVVAVRAGRLYDGKSGTLLTNQVVLIKGDRIAEIGPAVQIPPGAKVLDLSGATVMPGMIDLHVHVGERPGPHSIQYRTLVSVANAQ